MHDDNPPRLRNIEDNLSVTAWEARRICLVSVECYGALSGSLQSSLLFLHIYFKVFPSCILSHRKASVGDIITRSAIDDK